MRNFWRKKSSGQALVEFAIIFPIQLVLTFGLLQLIFLLISSLMVNYTAFRVARTAAVYGCNHHGGAEAAFHAGNGGAGCPCVETARIILAPLSFTNTGSARKINVPGWGGLRGSDAAADKIQVRAVRDEQGGKVTVTLTYYQELVFPFVDALFGMCARDGKKIMGKKKTGNRWCFPLSASSTMRCPEFDVSEGSEAYNYNGAF